jgi:hypothetical protein
MTDEQINQAIDKAVMWESETSGPSWYEYETKRPNYAGCLNAMHEVEKMLTNAQWGVYINYLTANTKRDYRRACAEATARIRAEAFLKTLNLYMK